MTLPFQPRCRKHEDKKKNAPESHARLALQLPNDLGRLRLAHPRRLHRLPALPRHGGNVPRLLPRRLLVARRPGVRVLDRRPGLGVGVLGLGLFELVDLGGGFGFVHRGGVDGDVFGGGEGGEEGFLLGGGGVGARGPLGGVVELGGHGFFFCFCFFSANSWIFVGERSLGWVLGAGFSNCGWSHNWWRKNTFEESGCNLRETGNDGSGMVRLV